MPFLYRILSNEAALRRWEICENPLVIGRCSFAGVQIPDDDQMSREHFVVFRKGTAFLIEDLKSTNGTWVNGEPVTRRELEWNDHIVAGRTSFCFEQGMQTAVHDLERLRTKQELRW